MYLGIDCGTQGLKAIVYDISKGLVASAASSYDLIEGLPAGHKEQDPQIWIDALEKNMAALTKQGVELKAIKGIGVSGQQHGLVVLDENKQVIRASKLWCDTSTQSQCDEIVANSNGKYAGEVGNGLPPGFTASKILWLKQNEPDNYNKMAHFFLPHDYLNFYLTGEMTAEAGDASGSGYFSVSERRWSADALKWIDGERDLSSCLPRLIEAHEQAGTLKKELADKWGMSTNVVVSSGGGDNMMGAIGSGNVNDGQVTVSLGTSGTIFSYSSKPIIDPQQEIAAFCDSTGAWMPLACTMNVTVTTELVRNGFMDSMGLEDFNKQIASVPVGSDGLIFLPYLEGERLPNIPNGTGVLMGLRHKTANSSHMARAAMEGVTMGLNYGLNRMKELGVSASEIRLIGGGAKSAVWRQICADVFQAPIVSPEIEEGPALGAAFQAMWCCEGGDIKAILAENLKINEETRATPDANNVSLYNDLYQLSVGVTKSLEENAHFNEHRKYLNKTEGN